LWVSQAPEKHPKQHSLNLANRHHVTKSKSENPANQLTAPSSKISCQQHVHEILMSIWDPFSWIAF
jgi:hypothetical protein